MSQEIRIDLTDLPSSVVDANINSLIEEFRKVHSNNSLKNQGGSGCAILIVKHPDSDQVESDLAGGFMTILNILTSLFINCVNDSEEPDILKKLLFMAAAQQFKDEANKYSGDENNESKA